jgi:RNA polymerase sigma-70 factor (ECF subfamily)
VCTIARFKVLETLRKERRSFQTLSDDVIEAICTVVPQENRLSWRLEMLDECIKELSPNAREALELRYQRGHRLPEVAERMGWTVDSTKVMLSRVRAGLRNCIERKLARSTI